MVITDQCCRSWMSSIWNQKVSKYSLFLVKSVWMLQAGVAHQFRDWPKILHNLQAIKPAVTGSIAYLFATTRYPRAINRWLASGWKIKRSNTGFLKVTSKTYWASLPLCAIWHPCKRDKPPMNGILQCFLVLLQQLSLTWVIFCSVFPCFGSLLTASVALGCTLLYFSFCQFCREQNFCTHLHISIWPSPLH